MNDLAPISIAIAPFCKLSPVQRRCTSCGSNFTGHQFAAWCPGCIDLATLAEHMEQVALEQRRARASFPSWASFAQFDGAEFKRATARAPGIVATCQKWEPAEGNLVLVGPTGVGKTATAVALFFRLAERALDIEAVQEDRQLASGAFFCTAADLVAANRAHPLGRGPAPQVRRAIRARLLVLDELGFEPRDETIFGVIDARYKRRLAQSTIATTALDRHGLRERYGDAFVRRLLDPGRLVTAKGAP